MVYDFANNDNDVARTVAVRGDMPAVTYKWYDGDIRPALPNLIKDEDAYSGGYHANGSFIVGEEGILQTDEYSAQVRILPDSKFRELRPSLPERSLRRIRGSHLEEFLSAVRDADPQSPSTTPAAMAMTFLSAPPSST